MPALGEDAALVREDWHSDARVQICGSARDVPSTPPGPGTAARLVLVACHDVADLPGWLADLPLQVVTVGTLSWVELEAFLAAHLRGPVELDTARTLSTATGAVPDVLAWLLHELDTVGALERVDGLWRLLGDPIPGLFERHVRARLAALSAHNVEAITRLALTDPIDAATLAEPDAGTAERLRQAGIVAVDQEGRLGFRSPAVAAALRRISSPSLASGVYRTALESGTVTPQALAWATREGEDVSPGALLRTVENILASRQWLAALDLAEAVLDHLSSRPGGPTDVDAHLMARIHVAALEAARWKGDADRGDRHIAELGELVVRGGVPEEIAIRARILEADIVHFVHGDHAAALESLRTTDGMGSRGQALVLGHRFIHLVMAGEVTAARDLLAESRTALRQAPHALATRIKIASTLLTVIEGRPQQALRKAIPLLATTSVTLRSQPTIVGDAQAAYAVAALNADGPAASPALARRFEALHDDDYRADLVGFALARAEWALASGHVGQAHQLGMTGLAGAAQADPVGLAPALVALLAETSALLGDSPRTLDLVTQFETAAPMASASLRGASHAHIAVARCLSAAPRAYEDVAAVGTTHADAGRLGFAAEVWYAGVRMGARRAARLLTALAPHLDGRLHRMRIDHAHALIDEDPLALMAVADRLEAAGLPLYATEAAARVTTHDAASAALIRQARSMIGRLGVVSQAPGHGLLRQASTTDDSLARALTARESEILELINAGLSNADIAERLTLSVRTVEAHITRLYRKTGGGRRAPLRRSVG